jgi:hypothetical protein
VHRSALFAVALAVLIPSAAHSGTTKDEARAAASRFGAALTAARAADVRSMLPAHGKVRIALARLAQENGSFGAGQVEALLQDSLARVSVQSFEVLRLESDEKTFALVHGRVALTDQQGRACRVVLHLSFQPENGSWALREIKETLE